ncbi:MAG TPA: hypothetical protein VE422_46925 [Terriglobia bacterium]|nr:hypothetical protein [Terriglobia bacterium]
MKKSSSRSDAGSILIAVSLALILVLTLVVALADQILREPVKRGETGTILKEVYTGIVGNPDVGSFGYLGDTGTYPASLNDLLTNPGVAGWNGPYVQDIPLVNGMLYDFYGSSLEYFTSLASGSLDQVAVLGRGLDHGSTNTAANPNVAATFAGVLPNNAGYPAANPDNIPYPDFYTNLSSLSRENVGALTFDIRNFDPHTSVNAIVAGCPGLYSINVTSVPRGTADTINLQYPSTLYSGLPGGASLADDFVQGVYDVEVQSLESQGSVWRERVPIAASAVVSRNIIAPRIDSSATPQFTLTAFNNGTLTMTVRVYGNSQGTVTTGTPIRNFTVRACSLVTVTQGANTWDTFLMPYGNYTRYVKAPSQTTYTLTVTNNGANSDQVKVVHQAGLLIGTVYNRKTRIFTIPGNPSPNSPGNAGVAIQFRRKDDTVISTSTFTASATVTIP